MSEEINIAAIFNNIAGDQPEECDECEALEDWEKYPEADACQSCVYYYATYERHMGIE